MGRRKKWLTQEQIDFRNSILRGKIKEVKVVENIPVSILSYEDKFRQCFYYTNNCIYWLNEFIDGRIDKTRLLHVAKSLQLNGRQLELLILELNAQASVATEAK